MKSAIKYGIYLLAGLAIIVLVQTLIPKPIDWSRTFKTTDKIPYGLYVLNEEIPAIVVPSVIEKYANTPYEYYQQE